MKSTLAVIILNWNGREFLGKFLPSVVKYSGNAEIIIADNDSRDDSLDFLSVHYPDLRIIRNSKNGGFAKGYNDALKQVDARYYCLLNSDIEVTPGWTEPVIALMDSDPAIVACQPKLRSFYDPEKFEYAGGAGGYIDKYGYPFCRGRLFQTLEKDHGQYDDQAEIFWATGACMFVRSDVFHLLGGFDERFFAHMEEIDFCWRAKIAGYKIMYCPRSVVYHVGGGTLPKKYWRKTYLNMRNNNIMLYKNLPSDRLFKVIVARLFLDGIAALKFLVDGGIKDFYAVIRAHLSYYRHLPELRRERKTALIHRVSNIYLRNLVYEYYLLRKRKFSDLSRDKFSL